MKYQISLFNTLAFFMLLFTVYLGFALESDIVGFAFFGIFLFITVTLFMIDGVAQLIFNQRKIVFWIELIILVTFSLIFLFIYKE